MAENMLQGRSGLKSNPLRPGQEKFELLYRTAHKNHPPSCAAVLFDLIHQNVSGRSCVVYDDGERLVEVLEGDDHKSDSTSEHSLLQEYLNISPVCLTCYCEINAA
ncbi:hypothetical protein PMIN05_003936 [Paraphaeosphaeria minitans]